MRSFPLMSSTYPGENTAIREELRERAGGAPSPILVQPAGPGNFCPRYPWSPGHIVYSYWFSLPASLGIRPTLDKESVRRRKKHRKALITTVWWQSVARSPRCRLRSNAHCAFWRKLILNFIINFFQFKNRLACSWPQHRAVP